MPDNRFIGNALDVADICTITVLDTWATSDTATITLNEKSLIVTVGTPFTAADVAALICAAWESTDRINAATGSSNVGGQSIPEFRLIKCTVSGAVLTFTTRQAADAGVPFQSYLTRAETTAGDGTLGAITSVQAATGKSWWSNADNWSLGTPPANDETWIFENSAVDCIYGLPQGSLEGALVLNNSYVARLGLPRVRNSGANNAHLEYLDRYVQLDNAGSGSTASHILGRGLGEGPKLVNIHQTALATTFEVNNNRQQPPQGEQYVHNLIAPAGATFRVAKGSVFGGDQDGGTAAVTAVHISGTERQITGIDVDIPQNATASLTVNQIGGRLSLGQTSWSSNGLTMRGGETVLRCPCPSLVWADGTVYAETGAGTITAGTANNGAVLNTSRGSGALTITNITRHPGSAILDPGKRITHTNPVVTAGKLADILRNDDYGYGRSYQISG